MPTAPSEQPAEILLLFAFDGTLYVGDLPILAFARHCSDQLSIAAATDLVDNIRFFLEGKSYGDRIVDLSAAADGFQAVEILAVAAGLSQSQIEDARRAGRRDLARSAFALDAPEGLIGLFRDLPAARVVVVTDADPTGVHEVLEATGVSSYIHQVITGAGVPDSTSGIIKAALDTIGRGVDSDRMMVVGNRWADALAAAHHLGTATAMVDRFGRGDGTPTLRADTLGDLVPGLRDWALSHRPRQRVR